MTPVDEFLKGAFVDVELFRDQMHAYQNEAVEFLKANPYSALFIDLGLGKSIISLTTIVDLIVINNFNFGAVLVIAPIRVANETWPTEIRTWEHTTCLSFKHVRNTELDKALDKAGELARKAWRADNPRPDWLDIDDEWGDFKYQTIQDWGLAIELWGKESERISGIARAKEAKRMVRKQFEESHAAVHLINRENVEFLVDAWGKDWPYRTVVIDESSSFKDFQTGRWKALHRVRPLIKRMHQLTATPVAESYMGLWAQIRLLDGGERLGRAITHYRDNYFTYNKYRREFKLRPGADKQITKLISDICLTMKAEDYLSREKPNNLKNVITLSDDEMMLYRTMEAEAVVTLPDASVVTADSAAAVSQKLLQMASGMLYETRQKQDRYGYLKPYRVVHQIHNRKVDMVNEIIEQSNGENLLIAYWHEESLARLQKAFPHAVVMDEDGTCVPDWNAGKIKILLMHPQSGGHGLNLQKRNRRLVFFDIPWSAELYQQMVGRLDRQGQKEIVIVHHLIVKDTLDELVMEAQIEKAEVQDAFFVYLKLLRRLMKRTPELTT